MDIDLGVFSLPIPIAIVSTASVIYDALARDPDPNTMAGLYAAGDPNIEEVKMRKICLVSHPFSGL